MPDDYAKFVQPRADEELHHSELSPVAIGTSTEDGLPMQVAPRNFDVPPGLSTHTLICIEDRRSFVLRHEDTGIVLLTFAPEQVSRLPNGLWGTPWAQSKKLPAIRTYRGASVLPRLVQMPHGGVEMLIVEPIRPECAHYLRLQTDIASDRDARYLQRACRAQRSEDGEYYSVRDTLIAACNLRSPRHFETEVSVLDAFDESKIAQALAAKEEAAFDIDAELEREKNSGGDLGVLG